MNSFNRTIVELKPMGAHSGRCARLTFNRTIVELKLSLHDKAEIVIDAFNRTIVELKRRRCKSNFLAALLLIVLS